MKVDRAPLRTPHFILRFVEMIFAIIAFACVCDYIKFDYINFMIFTGVSAMLLCLVFIALWVLGMRRILILPELIINIVWSIFWLCAAAALTAKLGELNDIYNFSSYSYLGYTIGAHNNDKAKVSVAFAWMSLVLWIASSVLSFTDMRKFGFRGTDAAKAPPSTAPKGPPGTTATTTPVAAPGTTAIPPVSVTPVDNAAAAV